MTPLIYRASGQRAETPVSPHPEFGYTLKFFRQSGGTNGGTVWRTPDHKFEAAIWWEKGGYDWVIWITECEPSIPGWVMPHDFKRRERVAEGHVPGHKSQDAALRAALAALNSPTFEHDVQAVLARRRRKKLTKVNW